MPVTKAPRAEAGGSHRAQPYNAEQKTRDVQIHGVASAGAVAWSPTRRSRDH
jgi:hypothetical protein